MFLNPCYYGTDIASRDVLIACNHTIDEIKDIIGADSVGFLSLENLPKIIENKFGYCDGCFTNKYPTRLPVSNEKSKFEYKISDKKE